MYRDLDEKFVEDNYGLVISYMVNNNLNIDDWHGVVSEAYLRSIKNYDSSRGALSTFFYKVTRNAVNSERKRMRARGGPYVVDGYYSESLRSGGVTLEAQDVDSEGFQRIMSELSEQEMEIVKLLHDGYTHREIGDRVGLARSSVSSVMRRLRRRLEGEGIC